MDSHQSQSRFCWRQVNILNYFVYQVKHSSFGRNKAVDLDKLETDFTILRPAGSRFILVADVSGSMSLCVSILTSKYFLSKKRFNSINHSGRIVLVNYANQFAVGLKMTCLLEVNSAWFDSGTILNILTKFL